MSRDEDKEQNSQFEELEGYSKIDRSFKYGDSRKPGFVGGKIVSHGISYVSGALESSKMEMFLQKELNVRVKRVELFMNKGSIITEAGMFQASEGDINFERIRLGLGNMAKSIISKKSGGGNETFFKQEIKGTGRVILKDTTSYLKVLEINQVTDIVFEKGSFYALIGNFDLGVTADFSVSNVMLSNREKVLPSARGRGYVILESAVNINELVVIRVTPKTPAVVDGDYVIARVGNVKTVEGFAGGVRTSLLNKTGIVTKYIGRGYIILAPSLSLYDTKLTDNMTEK